MVWVTTTFHRHLLVRRLFLLFHLLVVVIQQSHDQRCCCVRAQQLYYPSAANSSTRWTVSVSNITRSRYYDFIPLLIHQSHLERTDDGPYAPSFAFGFFVVQDSDLIQDHYVRGYKFYLAIFIALTDQHGRLDQNASDPKIVWSANRDRPVKNDAVLILTGDGELQLKHANGSHAWSSNRRGVSPVGMELRESGNLVLFDSRNRTLWQSFDHPTDTLLPGQTLQAPQSLIANLYSWPYEKDRFHVSHMAEDGFGAFVGSDPPLLYYRFSEGKSLNYLNITAKSLTFVANNSGSHAPSFVRLDSDGHMKLSMWLLETRDWSETDDVIKPLDESCGFPNVCGSFGFCTGSSCTCRLPWSSPGTKLCGESLYNYAVTPRNRFWESVEIYYPNYYMTDALLYKSSTTVEICKQACLQNYSCVAALFRYDEYPNSKGSCYLPREVFSFVTYSYSNGINTNKSFAYIKDLFTTPPEKRQPWQIFSIALGARAALVVFFGIVVAVYIRIKAYCHPKEDDIPQVPGMLARFSYEYLRSTTYDFSRKLGTGGFGSVFSGILGDSTVVAVKLLQSVHQGKREFLAEVQTIGSIHHLNLVRLIGFCADKSHRLLVYEYMSNGSLDKWIFGDGENSQRITWETSRKIIRDVANGLHYLHEECRQRIAHLDIKPQNILLDSSFNAKISDFGMAKLIDRDMSSVNTIMRGTPGYLAPEWLTSTVTEKADIYSFGVVIVEIVCRRRNIDSSQPEEGMHLLALLREKAMSGSLSEILAAASPDDVQSHGVEMEKMLKLAMWCLQSDVSKRPSMSTVIMVLDGTKEIRDDLDYDFTSMYRFHRRVAVDLGSSTPLLASELSGPR